MNKNTILQTGFALTFIVSYAIQQLPLTGYSVSATALICFLIGGFTVAFFIRKSRNDKSEQIKSLIETAITRRVSGVEK